MVTITGYTRNSPYGARVLTTILDLFRDSAIGKEIDDSLFDADLAIITNPDNLDKEQRIK